MKQYKITPYYLLALLVLIMGACSKMDDYKAKYMVGGSLTYPGIMDSVKIFSGKNRVQITGLFTSDPKIAKYKVYWNSRQDSVEVPVTRTAGVDTASIFIGNLPEGTMSFEIRTYDTKNHKSIPIYIAANVFGDLYQSGIINRGVVKADLQADNSALIKWVDANSDAGAISMEIKYTNSNGVLKDTIIPSVAQGLSTSLPKFVAGNKFSYRTAYRPVATAIDVFYSEFQNQNVTADVTSLYLKNCKQPFTRTNPNSWDRFLTPTDWTVTTAALNHNGSGGWMSDDGTVLGIEAGWGAPGITNGKMFQTITLPAGNYSFTVSVGSNWCPGNVYLVAAAGTILPDEGQISTNSLAYFKMINTSATVLGNSVSFTVPTDQKVTVGFVFTMPDTGAYWRVTKVQLFSK